MAMNIVRRIFANRPLPSQDAGEEEFKKQFDQAVKDFEEGGYLEQNKLAPINTEYDLVEKLHQHKNDLVVLKFWKRGCLPCLGLAEMYKQAEQQFQGKNVVFFSMNTKEDSCLPTVAHQLVEGTPTVQVFYQGKQVGDEIMAQSLNSFMDKINGYKKECGMSVE